MNNKVYSSLCNYEWLKLICGVPVLFSLLPVMKMIGSHQNITALWTETW